MPAKKTATKKTTTKKTAAKKAASPKARTASTKAKTKAKTKAGDKEVTIDRRTKADRRDESEQATTTKQPERREKVQRRRQIDPTTCERDYSVAEVEFMNAMDDYKRKSGRMFPTCSEVLEVIRNLGYVQLSPAEMAIVRPEPVEAPEATDEAQDEFAADELEVAEAAF